MKKKYKFGLVVGRFQPLHNGHAAILRKAAEECEWVIVGIGSAQEHNTARNPYSYTFRSNMINYFWHYENLNAVLMLMPLVDIGAGDSPIWGKYVMNSYKYLVDNIPEVYYTGTENDRNKSFSLGEINIFIWSFISWFFFIVHNAWNFVTIDIKYTIFTL